MAAKCLIVSLVFSHLGFWSGNLFLIAPFPDLCLLVPHYPKLYNMVHLLALNVLLLPKDLTIIFILRPTIALFFVRKPNLFTCNKVYRGYGKFIFAALDQE